MMGSRDEVVQSLSLTLTKAACVTLQSLADEVHAMLQGTSLYLVGMMGSGKSTVGRLVGKALKYPLLDTDKLVEQSAKATVSEIFADEGEEAFRDMETEVLNVSPCFSPIKPKHKQKIHRLTRPEAS